MQMTVISRCVVVLWCALVMPARAAEPTLEDANSLARHALELIDARLALMPEVAAAKWLSGQPVADPDREAIVIRSAGDAAAALGLDRTPAEALFAEQIARARDVQADAIAAWQAAGQGPAHAPSLRDELRPRIDRLTHDLLAALYLAAPVIDQADPSVITTALPARRWSDHDREVVWQALRAVRLTGPRTVQRMQQAGVLRVGVPADYAPFAWSQSGRLTGADIVLTTRLADQLGLKVTYIRSSWATLLADFTADHFDIAAGGISVTAARQAVAEFSPPLTRGGKTALGRCADTERFSTAAAIDRPGVRVIENPGGTNELYARRHLTRASLTIHTDNVGVFEQLASGHADVMYTDDIEIARITHRDSRLCRLLPDIDEPADKAILLPREQPWQDTISEAVMPLLREGGYQNLLDDAIAQ